jgi:hypothetical protein
VLVLVWTVPVFAVIVVMAHAGLVQLIVSMRRLVHMLMRMRMLMLMAMGMSVRMLVG